MDRNRHFAQTALLTLHLALLCMVLCLSGGCEEAIVNSPPVSAGSEPAITVAADLEVVAEAIGNALGEPAYPAPEVAGEGFKAETGDVKVEMAVMSVVGDGLLKKRKSNGILEEARLGSWRI